MTGACIHRGAREHHPRRGCSKTDQWVARSVRYLPETVREKIEPQGFLLFRGAIRAERLDSHLKAGESYAAEFTATRDGEVFVFVNDAFGAIPFWGTVEGAYANNMGLATVAIVPVEYTLPIPK